MVANTKGVEAKVYAISSAALMLAFLVITATVFVAPYFVPSLSRARAAAEITIDETAFPDASFRAYVARSFDIDNNGALSEDECARVINLGTYDSDTFEVIDKGISASHIISLVGIEYFPKLESIEAGDNSIEELDISQNKALRYLDMRGNPNFNLVYDESNLTTQILVSENFAAEQDASGLNIVKAS